MKILEWHRIIKLVDSVNVSPNPRCLHLLYTLSRSSTSLLLRPEFQMDNIFQNFSKHEERSRLLHAIIISWICNTMKRNLLGMLLFYMNLEYLQGNPQVPKWLPSLGISCWTLKVWIFWWTLKLMYSFLIASIPTK